MKKFTKYGNLLFLNILRWIILIIATFILMTTMFINPRYEEDIVSYMFIIAGLTWTVLYIILGFVISQASSIRKYLFEQHEGFDIKTCDKKIFEED